MSDPRLLAAGAAGFASAAAALWAFRGLPLGTALFWLSSFPLFAAGLAFGSGVAAGAAATAAALLALFGGPVAAVAFIVLFGAPAALLLAAGLRGGGFRPGLPLALLGLWPVAVLLVAAFLIGGGEELQAAMRATLEATLGRAGFAVPEPALGQLVRVKAAAIGFLSALALLANGFAARRFLLRRGAGLAVPPPPDPSRVRLPVWYPLLPALAAGLFLAVPAGSDAVPLSALLLLLVPLLLMGVAGVHARAKGRPARVPMLALFYLLLALFLQVMGPALVGLGLYDQFRRRAPSAPPSV
jgi:hypothetical protein